MLVYILKSRIFVRKSFFIFDLKTSTISVQYFYRLRKSKMLKIFLLNVLSNTLWLEHSFKNNMAMHRKTGSSY